MLISIVIRTLNESRHLGELLACIRAQEVAGHEVEIVLVDSGSTDRTLEIAAEHGGRVTHIARQEFTFGRSLNRGCEAARGAILVFVSGHCIPHDRQWLAQLVAPLVHRHADYTFGRQTGRDTTKFSEQQVFERYYPARRDQAPGGFFCNNANAALLRSAWEAQRFDESVTGLEDMMFARELIARGGRVAYVPEAIVYHIHDETWRQILLRFEREALALRAIMPDVHLRRRDFVRYFAAGVAHDLQAAARQGVLMSRWLEIVAFRFVQYYGAYLGSREHRRVSARRRDEYYYPKAKRVLHAATPDCPAADESAQRASPRQEFPPAGGQAPR
jgi:rhamnosyltransferase